jgi:hypothetical protein
MLSSEAATAGALYGINHTHWAINRFSVDGQPAHDIVGPYQRGGGGWGYSAPANWTPGLTVKVDWKTGVAYPDGFPGYANDAKYEAWAKKIRAQKRQLSKQVPLPDYTHQKTCGLTVHFLPCDDIQVTTSCYPYGHAKYPIKTPLHLPEPTSCPGTASR